MKMRPFTINLGFVLLVVMFVAFALSGCAVPQPDSVAQSPEAIAKQFCPSATIALASLQSLDGISAANSKALTDISNVVTPICAAVESNAQVAPLDLKAFAAKSIPVLTAIVKTSTLEAAKQNPILLDLAVAQIAIGALP